MGSDFYHVSGLFFAKIGLKLEWMNVRHLLLQQLLDCMVKANVKHNPNSNPNPNLNPYPTLNQKPNHYPHSNSLLLEISSQEQYCRRPRSKCWITQGCQLSLIERETHAFHPNLTLSRWYANISRLKSFFFFFVLVRDLWCTKGASTMCLQNRGKNFEVGKKSVGWVSHERGAHQLFGTCATL